MTATRPVWIVETRHIPPNHDILTSTECRTPTEARDLARSLIERGARPRLYRQTTAGDVTTRQHIPAHPPAVRFWTWINDDLARLTLQDGQTLTHRTGYSDEEGYSRTVESWTYEDGIVKREIGRDSTDCDGRHSYYQQDFCEPADLAGAEAWERDGMRVPAWSQASQSQRDHSAEAAGY